MILGIIGIIGYAVAVYCLISFFDDVSKDLE
jgi:hypothetical protein